MTFVTRTRRFNDRTFSLKEPHLYLRFQRAQPQMWFLRCDLLYGDGRLRLRHLRNQTAATRTSVGGDAGRGRRRTG